MVLYCHSLYQWISLWLDVFECNWKHREDALADKSEQSRYDVIVFGPGALVRDR